MSNLEELPDGVVVFRFFKKLTSARARTETTRDTYVEQGNGLITLHRNRISTGNGTGSKGH